jgi:hypothetical protein
MTKEQIIEKLRDDDHYYGEFGRQFLSNSNIKQLLEDPLSFGKDTEKTVPMLAGGYFHTRILEPDKLQKYKIVQASTRNTTTYKTITNGELCLLEHEVDELELLTDTILENNVCRNLIREGEVEYEVPNIVDLHGVTWKCKADILNHSERLIVDLKTTSDIDKFRSSANTYNYDSQAYIYEQAFGYKFVFIVICKKSRRIGIFDCSDRFLQSGQSKVMKAVDQYDLFFKTDDFDPKQYFITETH